MGVPFQIVDMSEAEKKQIREAKTPEEKQRLEAEFALAYQGPRFQRQFLNVPPKISQLSVEQAQNPPPLGATGAQILLTLQATPSASALASTAPAPSTQPEHP